MSGIDKILLCGPTATPDNRDDICGCGHPRWEHLKDSCPCWYFHPPTTEVQP